MGFVANEIHVLDAVPDSELQSSLHIYQRMMDGAASRIVKESIFHTKLYSGVDFEAYLDNLEHRARTDGCIPIIHIDGHGSTDQFQLPNGDLLAWAGIFEKLRAINIATKNNLFVTCGACYSAWGFRAAVLDKPTPVFGLYAPSKEISVGESSAGFQALYGTLQNCTELGDAIRAMTVFAAPKKFAILFAEDFFTNAAAKYIRGHCMGAGRQARIEQLTTKLVESGMAPSVARKHLRAELKRPQALRLKVMYEHFMMLDRFPDIRSRLKLNLGVMEARIRRGETFMLGQKR